MENKDRQKIEIYRAFDTLKLAPLKKRQLMRVMDDETEKMLTLLHKLEHECGAPPHTVIDGLIKLSWALEEPVSMIALAGYILDHGDKEKAKQIHEAKQCLRERYERYNIT